MGAGMLRVFEMEELFEAVETLDRFGAVKRERVIILSSGRVRPLIHSPIHPASIAFQPMRM